MPNKNFVYSYNKGSEGAAIIAQQIGGMRIKHSNSRFRGNDKKTVINWGSSELPEEVHKCNIVNTERAVALCTDKLKFFEGQKGIEGLNIPEFTTDKKEAVKWIEEEQVVVCRTKLRGQGGDGIVIATSEKELVNAKLYTRYIPKKEEYRVHVFNGKVLSIQRKALREGVKRKEDIWRVRNTANGFVFVRNDGHVPPECVSEQAVLCVNQIEGLTFGAVDLVYNKYRNKAYILEVNTAPGLCGTTIEEYSQAFKELLNG